MWFAGSVSTLRCAHTPLSAQKKYYFSEEHNTAAQCSDSNSTTHLICLFLSTTTPSHLSFCINSVFFPRRSRFRRVFFRWVIYSLCKYSHNHQNRWNDATMGQYLPPLIFAATSLHNINRICEHVYFSQGSRIFNAFRRRGKSFIIFDRRKYSKIVPMAAYSTAANSP